MDALAETDIETGATYVRLSSAPVASTRHVADLVMVDLDSQGEPVGVEFAGGQPDKEDALALFNQFPSLKETLGPVLDF